MANGLPIDKETFHQLKSPEAKMDALFDYLVHMTTVQCERRFKTIEDRKWRDRSFSGAMGAVTGFLAGLLK